MNYTELPLEDIKDLLKLVSKSQKLLQKIELSYKMMSTKTNDEKKWLKDQQIQLNKHLNDEREKYRKLELALINKEFEDNTIKETDNSLTKEK